MSNEGNKQNQPRSWQPPRYETTDEKARREEKELQARFLMETVKQALDEYFTERADAAKARKKRDPFAELLGLD